MDFSLYTKWKGKLIFKLGHLQPLCDSARSEKAIIKQFPKHANWLRERLEVFIANDLMIYLDERYLSLALPVNRYQ